MKRKTSIRFATAFLAVGFALVHIFPESAMAKAGRSSSSSSSTSSTSSRSSSSSASSSSKSSGTAYSANGYTAVVHADGTATIRGGGSNVTLTITATAVQSIGSMLANGQLSVNQLTNGIGDTQKVATSLMDGTTSLSQLGLTT